MELSNYKLCLRQFPSHSFISLPSNSNKLIVRHCVRQSYVEHYKLIDENSDSFDQIQNIEFPLTSRCIRHFNVIGSANGLFSLYEQERYILWNPSIRKFITLPKPCITVKTHGSFACRPAFGLDPPSGPLVLSFDLRDEVFHVISLPNFTFKWTDYYHTSVIGGSLSLLFYYGRHADNKCCDIWVMKEYGVVDSWTKQFTVDVNGGVEIIRVLGLQRNGNIIVEEKVRGPSRCELSSYDPKSEQVKNLGICGRSYYFHVDNYMENLGLLDKPDVTVSKRRVSRKRKCRYKLD